MASKGRSSRRSSLSSRGGSRKRHGDSGRPIPKGLAPFTAWKDVLFDSQLGEPFYYWAPMDARPVRFIARSNGSAPTPGTYEARARTIRIWPPGSVGRGRYRTSDPFTADAGHLDRFYHQE